MASRPLKEEPFPSLAVAACHPYQAAVASRSFQAAVASRSFQAAVASHPLMQEASPAEVASPYWAGAAFPCLAGEAFPSQAVGVAYLP